MRAHSFFLGAAIVTVLAASSLSAEVLYHVTDLGTLGGPDSTAYSINNKGQIVGVAASSDPQPWAWYQPVLFDPTGEGNNIDLLPEWDEGQAFAINSLGQIVGYVGDSSYGLGAETWATLFDPTGHGDNVEFEVPDEWGSAALSINNAGQIVGSTHLSLFHPPLPPVIEYATLFDPNGSGHHVNLGGLGGGQSEAYSINNKGQIVGIAAPASGGRRATLFDSTGGGNNIDLGTLPGGRGSYARSINDFGQIVDMPIILSAIAVRRCSTGRVRVRISTWGHFPAWRVVGPGRSTTEDRLSGRPIPPLLTIAQRFLILPGKVRTLTLMM